MWRDFRDHVVNSLHHRLEAELRSGVGQSVFGAVLHLMGQLGAFDQRLARHATKVKAVTPHFVRFHQGHFGFDGSANQRSDQATGTGANHD